VPLDERLRSRSRGIPWRSRSSLSRRLQDRNSHSRGSELRGCRWILLGAPGLVWMMGQEVIRARGVGIVSFSSFFFPLPFRFVLLIYLSISAHTPTIRVVRLPLSSKLNILPFFSPSLSVCPVSLESPRAAFLSLPLSVFVLLLFLASQTHNILSKTESYCISRLVPSCFFFFFNGWLLPFPFAFTYSPSVASPLFIFCFHPPSLPFGHSPSSTLLL